jgi:hypothetical protein
MARADDYAAHEDPGWFRDELRRRDRLIADLGQEQHEARRRPREVFARQCS